jgi:hypothetical protein
VAQDQDLDLLAGVGSGPEQIQPRIVENIWQTSRSATGRSCRASVVGEAAGHAGMSRVSGTHRRTAANRPPSADLALAVVNAISPAEVTAHFSAWPRRTRFGLPGLEDCDGLSEAVTNALQHGAPPVRVQALPSSR